jgi:TetR/AcrR family transcriptional regulator, cholesterol catabolism regulator
LASLETVVEGTAPLTQNLNADVRKMRALVDDPELVALNRLRLVEVATHLFRTKGFHQTSTRDIATAADMSVGAIYQYIQHKEDLLLLILQSVVEIYEARVYPFVNGQGSPRDRLFKAMDVYYHTLDEHHAKTQVLYHEFSGLEGTAREYMNKVEATVGKVIEQLLNQGISAGEFAPVDALFTAHVIVSLGHMWALKRWRFRGIMTIDAYIAEAQRALGQMLAV